MSLLFSTYLIFVDVVGEVTIGAGLVDTSWYLPLQSNILLWIFSGSVRIQNSPITQWRKLPDLC